VVNFGRWCATELAEAISGHKTSTEPHPSPSLAPTIGGPMLVDQAIFGSGCSGQGLNIGQLGTRQGRGARFGHREARTPNCQCRHLNRWAVALVCAFIRSSWPDR
jgi:hypothetical protein